ncbi:MAG: LLM class flavin-dependent oxidoreductase [Chloroflexi bacterium]|nr:MAG: LLM class flavin-dependent oxidoreductase [Chloroflexota bacterium]
MKVGVVFPSRFEDPGEFLADARAMEAAGIDSIWLEEWDDDLDPLLMLAAVAAVTSQLRLGLIPESSSPLAREVQDKFPSPASGGGQGGGFDERRLATLQQLSRDRVVESSTERWHRVEVPADREAWASTLERAQQQDADGILVPFDPRLLDILRHPDDAIDRSDLILAQG